MLGAIAVFTAGLALVVHTARPGDGIAVLARDRIAVLPLRGMITADHRALRQLRDFREDASVKGYVLWVNSPGGEVAASQSLYRQLSELRDDGYPVVASIGSVGASGAYYAALGADTILTLPGSLVGSIGVLMEFPNYRELLDKIGLDMEIVKSSEHKDIGSPYRSVSEEERALLQVVVDDVYMQFVEAIVEEREIPRDSVLKVADGRILSGRLALEYGLVDGEGDLVDAIAAAGNMAGLGPEPRTVMREERRVTWLDLVSSASRWIASGGEAAAALREAIAGGAIEPGPRLLYLFRYR
ncbi:MAG: signal peptide peptidase SppA [Gemmatimonadetes bacterium]|nr:signal peptide peptidase SppA [Gemmatimonadota bacterium]